MLGPAPLARYQAKSGRVTVPGKLGDNLAPGTLNSIYKQAGWKQRQTMKYAVVIEAAGAKQIGPADAPAARG